MMLQNASILGTLEMVIEDKAPPLQDVVTDVGRNSSLLVPDHDYGDCICIC